MNYHLKRWNISSISNGIIFKNLQCAKKPPQKERLLLWLIKSFIRTDSNGVCISFIIRDLNFFSGPTDIRCD